MKDRSTHLPAATPDALAACGPGVTLHAGYASSPFGDCLIGETARGVCHLAFFDEDGPTHARATLQAAWPRAKIIWNDARAARLAATLFACPAGVSPSPPWKLHLCGTPFQLDVWRALLEVPAGSPVSYGQLAAAAGHPHAARATGSAVAANRIAWLIPCHRVILATGQPGQYRWGSARKRCLLAWEDHWKTAAV